MVLPNKPNRSHEPDGPSKSIRPHSPNGLHDPNGPNKPPPLPLPFQIGTASAAMQIEGSMPPSNWSRWAMQGRVVDGTSPNPTTDHWRRWQEDNQLMQDLALQIARVSVEWARVEPAPGQFDDDALQRYVHEYEDLVSRGITPLVTLHHFGHPQWFEQAGAFTREGNVGLFLRYVAKVVGALGGVVNDWVTINEPNVYATQAYLFNEAPPGRTSWKRLRATLRNMALAHIRAYQLIHEKLDAPGREINVTFAHHVRVFAPLNEHNPLHRAFAKLDAHLFQNAVEQAFFRGRFSLLMGKPSVTVKPGLFADAIAINYYSRSAVKGMSDGVFPDAPVNDLGWEIYPQGVAEVAGDLHRRLGLPVWITENGTADNARNASGDALERFRCRFILDHLTALATACRNGGVDVQRYYHWCFVDNWEWTEGMAQEFGVVAMKPGTLDRVVKPSGYLLRDLIREGAITSELRERYTESGDYPRGIELSRPGADA